MQRERELAAYRLNLPQLLQHEGRYVLIRGDRLVDTFASYPDALRQGYRQFGLAPFLVKQVLKAEPVHFIARMAEPATG